jgi:hypothetical protein
MPPQIDALIYAASIWVIPLIIAITFHEAAHGYVARFFGDNAAWQLGRVTLNPFKHIDPIGIILLPSLLFMARSPFQRVVRLRVSFDDVVAVLIDKDALIVIEFADNIFRRSLSNGQRRGT